MASEVYRTRPFQKLETNVTSLELSSVLLESSSDHLVAQAEELLQDVKNAAPQPKNS